MAKLTTHERSKLPKKDFAGKDRSYPVEDKGHAKAAIARAKEFHPSDEKAIVEKAEHKLHGNAKGEKHSNHREHDKFLHHMMP